MSLQQNQPGGPTAAPALDQSGPAYRWIILLVVWAALLISFVDRLAWGNVAVQVGASLGMSVAALGGFMTAFFVGYVVSNAGGGFLIDWLGARRMLAAALLPLGLFTWLFSHTHSVAMGLTLQVLMGLAAGADYSACVKLVTVWFGHRDRGRAMGLLMTSSSLGVVVTNATVPTFVKSFGWPGAYQTLGAVTAALGVLCLLALRDNPPTEAPEAATAKPDFGALFKNRDLMFLALAGFGAMWGTWGFSFWANSLMIKGHHLTTIQAGSIMALFGVGAIFAKPLIGLLSDWLGGRRKALIIVVLFTFVVMLLVFGHQQTLADFRMVAPWLGIAAFVYSPLTAAMVSEVAGRKMAGSATGVTNAFWQLGNVVVPMVVGFAFQATHDFQVAFMVLAAGPLFGALCMFLVREQVREKKKA